MDSPANDAVVGVQTLFVGHLPALRGFVISLTGDPGLVDDIIQETFLTISAKASTFEVGTNFKAWAWSIARLKTLEALRKSGKHRYLAADVIESLCAHEEAFDWNEFDRMQRHVAACIEDLAPKARTAVELRYRHGHSAAEVARRMGWTANAIHVALSRARKTLRECVEKRVVAEGPSRPVG